MIEQNQQHIIECKKAYEDESLEMLYEYEEDVEISLNIKYSPYYTIEVSVLKQYINGHRYKEL
jgi:hypothetical protein